ncbi:MAG: hypothetical protein ACOCTM_04260 [Bacteroidota bacterium]
MRISELGTILFVVLVLLGPAAIEIWRGNLKWDERRKMFVMKEKIRSSVGADKRRKTKTNHDHYSTKWGEK